MNGLNVNSIDPLRVYVVRDLYRLYKRDSNLRLSNWHHREVLENFLMSSDELDRFLNKPLIHCTVRELKLVLLFHYKMTGITSIFDSNFVLISSYFLVQDGETIIQALLNRLDHKYCNYDHDPKKILCIDTYNSIWRDIIREGDISILDEINLVPIVGTGFLNISRSIRVSSTGFRTYDKVSSTMGLVTDEKVTKYGNENSWKRPFIENSEFPIIEPDNALLRFRDIISKFDGNKLNGLFRGVKAKLKFMGITRNEFAMLLHKDIDSVTQDDVNLIWRMAYKSEITYVSRSLRFHLKRPYFKEKGLVIPSDELIKDILEEKRIAFEARNSAYYQ